MSSGVLALPMDCFEIPEDVHTLPRMPWSEPNRALRVALAARARGDAYPLLLNSFGCGPGSFFLVPLLHHNSVLAKEGIRKGRAWGRGAETLWSTVGRIIQDPPYPIPPP